MSGRRIGSNQPDNFEFTSGNLTWAREQIEKYPEGRQASATIPLLWRAQEQHEGWLPEPAIKYVAKLLEVAPIRVMEVATFYTMFNLKPVGKYFIQLCGTTPCMLSGSDALIEVCKQRIGPQNHVTEDGLFSWLEVECLGACANAPMVQINKDYFEDLDAEKFETLLDDLAAGKTVQPGPQNGRTCSCPKGGPTSLTDPSLYDGKSEADTVVSNRSPKNAGGSISPATSAVEGEAKSAPISDEFKPKALAKARDGRADDLKKISGVGPKLEETLNSLGIFHYDQIAAWGEDTVAWVDNYLSFKGRIDRENWISQAKELAQGDKGQADDKKGDD